MNTSYTLKNKIIFSLLFTFCVISIQFAYAEPEFSFEFGTTGTGNDEFDNPTDVIVDKNGRNFYVIDSNNDRIKLNNEIVKITTFFQDKKITTDKLESLLDIRLNDDFNILKDVALIGNKVETNKLLGDTIIESEKNIFYINIINQRLYKLLELFKISDSKNFENFISKIKPPIFWKDKPHFIEQAKKWNSKKIKFVLEKTYSLELSIKTNATINKDILIKKLLVDICDLANA